MFHTFKVSITKEKCKEQIVKQDKFAFLFKLIFGQERVNTIHHFQEIGGNLGMDNERFGDIQGILKNGICIVTPDRDQLLGISEGNNSVLK